MIRALLFTVGSILLALSLSLWIHQLRNLVCWLIGLRYSARWRRLSIGEHDGVRIVDDSYRPDLQETFLQAVMQALKLVAQKDPRRYRRIRRHLGFVVHHELHGLAAKYVRWPSACQVDFHCFESEGSTKPRSFQLAATLVHEATHGRLASQWGVAGGLPRETRFRMERLCLLEEARFASRVDPRLRKVYEQALFRSERWRSWHEERERLTQWQKLTGLVKRFLESQEASNKPLHRMAAPGSGLPIRQSGRGRHR